MVFRNENKFREYVIAVAEKAGFQNTHIESPATSAGVPDLNLFQGIDIWLELKLWYPQRGVQMRPTQKRWHLKRYQSNGLSWVLVSHEDRLSLVPGEVAARLRAKDPIWIMGYREGPTSELPRVLRYCHRQAVYRLTKPSQPLARPA